MAGRCLVKTAAQRSQLGDRLAYNRAMRAEFHCAACAAPAGALELAPDGALMLSGFLGQVWLRVPDGALAELGRALRVSDELERCARIHALEPLWVPWYCDRCRAAYCVDHWDAVMEFEHGDELPGWYDCTRGTCPRGHTRLLDD